MSETKLLENKHIIVGKRNYRLTIKKKDMFYGDVIGYKAYLSDVDSKYTNDKTFTTINALELGLKAWIMESDMLNNPETRVFEELKQWDGVIE